MHVIFVHILLLNQMKAMILGFYLIVCTRSFLLPSTPFSFSLPLIMLNSLLSKLSFKSSQPGSSSLQEHQPRSTSNVFDEEYCFENHNQELDDWQLPKISNNEIHKLDGNWFKQADYIIKTTEKQIPLTSEEEEFHLLDEQTLRNQAKKYNYLHIGCIQVAIKPLGIEGLDSSILCCLRDIRHYRFDQSLIGTIETSLAKGPIFFNCFPNRTISLKDRNIRDALYLQIQTKGLQMKPGSIPLALIYRIQYKVMNSISSKVYKSPEVGSTTLFLTDFSKANVVVPTSINWDEVSLPESWTVTKSVTAAPRPTPEIREINQDPAGEVTITFNRSTSFRTTRSLGSNSVRSTNFRSARRSFSSVPSSVRLAGIDTASQIPRPIYSSLEDEPTTEIHSPTQSEMQYGYHE